MSAQNSRGPGVLTAMAGLLGFSALAGVLVTVMVAPAVAVTGVTASSTIGIFDSIPEYLDLGELPERNEIYVQNSFDPSGYSIAATVFDQNRESVGYDQISQFALDATVAGEDRRFFEHGGVDVVGVIRAAIGNVTSDGIESGASTLTMQLVKNTYVQEALEKPTEEERQAAYKEATDPNFDRKLKEMKIAIGLEKRYTKKEILVAYLNVAYFSDQTYGIEAAAQRYFGVSAANLTLAQSASLIAIVQYPNQRGLDDPENFGENEIRRDFILGQMLKEGFITQEQHDEAYAIPVDEAFVAAGVPPQNGCRTANVYFRWFCDYVVKSVKDFEFLGATVEEREANWARGGYTLYTTLDTQAQMAAQDALWTYTPPQETGFRLGSAASSVQPGTGRVLVMAANKVFDDALEPADPVVSSAVNFNTSISYGNSQGIQSGSTYKLFTLLDWLKTGHGVNEVLNGSARTEPASSFRDRCTGATGEFKFKNNAGESGNYSVRNGTVESINGIFVSMAKELDLCDINQLAASLGVEAGLETTLPNNPSSIIGVTYVTPLSMATAYAAVAAGGKTCDPIVVDRYIDPNGDEHVGQTSKCAQVLDPDVAYTAIDVLKGVMVSGNAAYSNPEDGIPIFGKTGTTDGGKDTNMASATTSAATFVWIGPISGDANILNTEYAGVSGIRLRHYITNDIMTALNNKYGGTEWPAPSGRLLTGGQTAVPNVSNIGINFDAAKASLEALGFSVADGGGVDSDRPAGEIVAQDPGGDTLTGRGTTVTLYYSKQNMVPFPNVVGLQQAAAISALNSANYTSIAVTCEAVATGSPDDGKVLATNPAPGAIVVPGGAVTLTVAKATGCGGGTGGGTGGGGGGGGTGP